MPRPRVAAAAAPISGKALEAAVAAAVALAPGGLNSAWRPGTPTLTDMHQRSKNPRKGSLSLC